MSIMVNDVEVTNSDLLDYLFVIAIVIVVALALWRLGVFTPEKSQDLDLEGIGKFCRDEGYEKIEWINEHTNRFACCDYTTEEYKCSNYDFSEFEEWKEQKCRECIGTALHNTFFNNTSESVGCNNDP